MTLTFSNCLMYVKQFRTTEEKEKERHQQECYLTEEFNCHVLKYLFSPISTPNSIGLTVPSTDFRFACCYC